MKELIESFFALVGKGKIEIYNEFSLQHEFGIFLREHMPGRKIRFERNVTYFGLNKDDFVKKEIDICVFEESSWNCAIELKYPRNGQYPETMYSFCRDIRFLEQLMASGFESAHFIAVADDKNFYSGNSGRIYGLFRGSQPITDEITKPTGKKDSSIHIDGCYYAHWREIKDTSKYCTISIQRPKKLNSPPLDTAAGNVR